MKREDLKALGLSDEHIDKIMALNGQDIEKQKGSLVTLQTEADGLKKQLEEAGVTIEGFKKLDIAAIQTAADEWKTKAEQAQKDAADQVARLRFDHALDGALSGAKARNPKAVRALLNLDGLKLNEADNSIAGLKEQIEKIQTENDFLFESSEKTPTIVKGGTNQPVMSDPVILAARQAAGLSTGQEK